MAEKDLPHALQKDAKGRWLLETEGEVKPGEVAVRADQQLQVSKQAEANSTAVAAQVLAADARVEEIARMLGGKVSEQSRAHAREMLEAASATLQ